MDCLNDQRDQMRTSIRDWPTDRWENAKATGPAGIDWRLFAEVDPLCTVFQHILFASFDHPPQSLQIRRFKRILG